MLSSTEVHRRVPLPFGRGKPFPPAYLPRTRQRNVEWSPDLSHHPIHDAHLAVPPRAKRRLPRARPARLPDDAFEDPAPHVNVAAQPSQPVVGLGLGFDNSVPSIPVVTGMPPIYTLDGDTADPPEIELEPEPRKPKSRAMLLPEELDVEEAHQPIRQAFIPYTPLLLLSSSSTPLSPTVLPLIPLSPARLLARSNPCPSSGVSSPTLSPSIGPSSPIISAPPSPVLAQSPSFASSPIFSGRAAQAHSSAGAAATGENVLPTVIASSVIGAVICMGAIGWLAFLLLRRRVAPPPRRIITRPVHVEDDDSLFEAKEKASRNEEVLVRSRGASFSASPPLQQGGWHHGATLMQQAAAGNITSPVLLKHPMPIPPRPVLLRSSSLTSASSISSGSTYHSDRSGSPVSSACTSAPSSAAHTSATHKIGVIASTSSDTFITTPETPTRIRPSVLANRGAYRFSILETKTPPPTPFGSDAESTDGDSVAELRELYRLNQAAIARVDGQANADPFGPPPPKPQRSPRRPQTTVFPSSTEEDSPTPSRTRPVTMPHPLPPTIFVTDHPQDLVPPSPPKPAMKHQSTASFDFRMSQYYPPGALFHSPSMASSFIGYVSRDDASVVDPEMAWEALQRERKAIERGSIASTVDTEYSVASTFDNFTDNEDGVASFRSRATGGSIDGSSGGVGRSLAEVGRRGSAIVASFPVPPPSSSSRTSIDEIVRPIIDPAITRFSRSDLDFDTKSFHLANGEGYVSSTSTTTIKPRAKVVSSPTKSQEEGTIASELRKSISFPSGYAALASLASPNEVDAYTPRRTRAPEAEEEDDDASSVYSRDSSARMSREWETARARVRARESQRASVSFSMLVAKGTASNSMANIRSIMEEEMPTAL